MRERMETMQKEMQEFFTYIQTEMLARSRGELDASRGAIIPVRRTVESPGVTSARERKR
jgi:hypothetical protein